MSRLFPALNVVWSLRPDNERIDMMLAEVDDESPTAVEVGETGLRLFFPTAVARGRAAVRLVAFDPTLICEPVEVSDDDWAARSQSSLGSIRVGDIVVAPPWARNDLGCRFLVLIEPSMGFGTGHHASTRLCLRLLQDLRLIGTSVLDVGTGSGVLAIAAARLGATRVVAIDNDQDALASARENVALNSVADIVALELSDVGLDRSDVGAGFRPPDDRPAKTGPYVRQGNDVFDVVLANLTGPMLVRLAPTFAHRVKPSGHLIASGVITDEVQDVVRALAANGFKINQQIEEDGWVGLELVSAVGSPS